MSTKNASDWLQAHHSRSKENFQQRTHFAKTIAVSGGKGGVGKTTMALNIARILGESSKKVLCLDFDYNLSNTALKLGLRPKFGLYDYFAGNVGLEGLVLKTPFFDLIPGHHGLEKIVFDCEEMQFKAIDLISQCEKYYDYILIDCPAGASKEILSLCAYADKRLMVVNPDISSITDTYSMIKLLKNIHGTDCNHILMNRIKSKQQFDKIIKSIGETVEKFLSGRVVFVGAVSDYAMDGENFDRSFFTEEKFDRQQFLKIASKLTEEGSDVSLENALAGSRINQSKVEVSSRII